ncbi:MAG: hypothetical protein K8F91_15755, partial [Candidatus Obscuribacterales bacterium]|nr:hypothetical protein [Candidatus Obscuribacterales bacterium]
RAAGLLSPLALEERVRVFNQVKDMNQEDLNQGRTKARLDVNIKATKVGTNEISVRRSLPGTHNFFSGGSMVYGESLSVRTGQRKVLDL